MKGKSPPLLHPSCLATPPGGTSPKHLYRVFTYSYSLLIKKDICDHQNISIKLPCVYVPFIRRSLFSVRVSPFFSLFWRIKWNLMRFRVDWKGQIVWIFCWRSIKIHFDRQAIPNFPHTQGIKIAGEKVYDVARSVGGMGYRNTEGQAICMYGASLAARSMTGTGHRDQGQI